jgi:Trp operon repressor
MTVKTNQVNYKLSKAEKEAIATVRNMMRAVLNTEMQQGNVASVLSKKVAFAMEGLQEFTHDDRILF